MTFETWRAMQFSPDRREYAAVWRDQAECCRVARFIARNRAEAARVCAEFKWNPDEILGPTGRRARGISDERFCMIPLAGWEMDGEESGATETIRTAAAHE